MFSCKKGQFNSACVRLRSLMDCKCVKIASRLIRPDVVPRLFMHIHMNIVTLIDFVGQLIGEKSLVASNGQVL